MPTAARLVAAICYAALAWFASQLIKPLFPEGADLGYFAEVNAAIGLVIGWRVAGGRAGTTWLGAFSYGLTTTVALVFWGLFLHCFAEMVRMSTRRLYDGPVDALVGVFALMLEYGRLLADPTVILTLVIGGIVAGLVTEWTGRNFR